MAAVDKVRQVTDEKVRPLAPLDFAQKQITCHFMLLEKEILLFTSVGYKLRH